MPIEIEGDIKLFGEVNRRNIALAACPGVMLGVYGGAQVSVIQDRGYLFKRMYGFSTGGPIVLYLAALAARKGTQIYCTHCTQSEFLSAKFQRIWNGTVLDADFLVNVFRGTIGESALDFNAVREHPGKVFLGVTRYADGEDELFNVLDIEDPFELIRGTIAVPGLYRRPVFINGVRYLDAGIGNPLPAEKILPDVEGVIVLANAPRNEIASWKKAAITMPIGLTLPRPTRERMRTRRERFYDNINLIRASGKPYCILWVAGDSKIGQYTRDPVALQQAVVDTEERLQRELDKAGV